MNQRTRILLGILIGVGALGAIYKTIYPNWIEPLFNYQDRIASTESELVRLEADWEKHKQTQARLKDYVARSGGTDSKNVKNDLQARVNILIETHNLVSKDISPSPARENRKSLLDELGMTVNAEGTLESVVKFLVACEELPQLMRIEEVDLRPISSGGRTKSAERVTLSCRLSAVVPPAKVLPGAVKPGDITQPENFVRHDGDMSKYETIWQRAPFTEWKPVVERKSTPVHEERKRSEKKVSTVPPPPPPPRRDTEAQVDMVAIFGDPGHMVYEVHVSGGRQPEHKDSRLSLGDKMDEGKIVLVHPLAVVVSKEAGEFVYPVGEKFGDSKALADAADYPQIQAMVEHLRARTVAHQEPAVEAPPQSDGEAAVGPDADSEITVEETTPALEGIEQTNTPRALRQLPKRPVKYPRTKPGMPVPITSAMKESAIPPAKMIDKNKGAKAAEPGAEGAKPVDDKDKKSEPEPKSTDGATEAVKDEKEAGSGEKTAE